MGGNSDVQNRTLCIGTCPPLKWDFYIATNQKEPLKQLSAECFYELTWLKKNLIFSLTVRKLDFVSHEQDAI